MKKTALALLCTVLGSGTTFASDVKSLEHYSKDLKCPMSSEVINYIITYMTQHKEFLAGLNEKYPNQQATAGTINITDSLLSDPVKESRDPKGVLKCQYSIKGERFFELEIFDKHYFDEDRKAERSKVLNKTR